MSEVKKNKRPFGVVVLVILAGIAAFLALVHTLQSLGLFPYLIGPFSVFKGFNLWNAIMWGLMVWVYIWLIQMLWRLDPQAWLFLAVMTVINLIIDFVYLVGSANWSDVSLSFLLNAFVLIYIMLPGVRKAFGRQ